MTMITITLTPLQRDQIVQGLQELAERIASPTCAERDTLDHDMLDAQVLDLRDLAQALWSQDKDEA